MVRGRAFVPPSPGTGRGSYLLGSFQGSLDPQGWQAAVSPQLSSPSRTALLSFSYGEWLFYTSLSLIIGRCGFILWSSLTPLCPQ